MKTENNLQNKATFFAQYWGQFVYSAHRLEQVNENYIQPMYETSILELKDVSQISDEDVIRLFTACSPLSFYTPKKWNVIRSPKLIDVTSKESHHTFSIDLTYHFVSAYNGSEEMTVDQYQVIDFLRSLGMAVQWRDLSIFDLFEYGWFKFKDHENKAD